MQLLDFISAAFSVPDSYPYHLPQLAEYYVRYHFGQFLRLYYAALPIQPDDVARCKGHLKVRMAAQCLQQSFCKNWMPQSKFSAVDISCHRDDAGKVLIMLLLAQLTSL